jgi:hypothetical protein
VVAIVVMAVMVSKEMVVAMLVLVLVAQVARTPAWAGAERGKYGSRHGFVGISGHGGGRERTDGEADAKRFVDEVGDHGHAQNNAVHREGDLRL